MKRVYGLLIGCAMVMAVGVAAAEEGHHPPAVAGSPAFERIKALAGQWGGTSQMGSEAATPTVVGYKVTSGGSAVVETLSPGTDHEMVSVYHDRNGKLMMTHYCMLGNQPELQLTDADDQHLTLSLAGTQGIGSAQEAHMHALSLAWSGPDQLTQTWTSYADGQPKDTAVFKLSRVKSH